MNSITVFLNKFVFPGRHSGKKGDQDIEKLQRKMRKIQFSFRNGFSERVISRLNNLSDRNPMEIYYNNLSGLFPKITGISIAILIVLGVIIFAIHGTLHPENLLGADKIDESNFISYLIYQK